MSDRRTATSRILPILGALLALLGSAPTVFVAHAASIEAPKLALDPGFGSGGLVRLSSGSSFETLGATAPDSSLILSGAGPLQLLSETGDTGTLFGAVGELVIPPVPGREFLLGAVELDPQGRLLIVGTSLLPESENPSPPSPNGGTVFTPGTLRILRLMPDGALDPDFGSGGEIETDLDFAAPAGTNGRPIGTAPSLKATGVAVAPDGRIVVTGNSVTRLGRSCERGETGPASIAAAFVTRLAEDGAPDTSFGHDGVVGGRGLGELPLAPEAIAEPLIGPSGVITYRSTAIDPCARRKSRFGIGQLTGDGRPRSSFEKMGSLPGRFSAISQYPQGAVVALSDVGHHEGKPYVARLYRISRNGKPSMSFGNAGKATVMLGPGYGTTLNALAIQSDGRIVIGGTLGTPRGRSIAILRVSRDGKWEKDLGPRGRVATRVGGIGQFQPSALLFDHEGRLIALDLLRESALGRSGLVVARYLLAP